MESIEGVSSESFEGVLEEANESEASRVIASARNALEKGEFETVVDLLRLMLEQSPLGEIHTNYSSEFFSILTDLFQINKEYFEQMLPLLEHHRMEITWINPYYFSLTHYISGYICCYKMISKLDLYDYNTAAKIISMYDNSRIKIDAYLSLALKFQDRHLTDAIALAEEELENLLENDPLSYIQHGVEIARTYLAFNYQTELERVIVKMESILDKLSKKYGNLSGIIDEKERLEAFKQEVVEFNQSPRDIQLSCASTSYIIYRNPNPNAGREVILSHPDSLLFDGVNGFIPKKENAQSSLFSFLW